MSLPALLAATGVLFVLAALAMAWHAATTRRREYGVLPSHYSSLLEYDGARYPGHCPACGTDNQPGFRICAGCGETIPSRDGAPSDADIGWIVDG